MVHAPDNDLSRFTYFSLPCAASATSRGRAVIKLDAKGRAPLVVAAGQNGLTIPYWP
jgi:hypothetical protein